ncbi:MAG: 30S ribosomal protein S1 [Deltaproteobacteria bacterium]|nr:30S ribosomal protein S1 [Deltaproteobacteria bacterium]
MTQEITTGESFADLFSATEKKMKEGEVTKGRILSIDDDQVQVDVGFKSEGFIDLWEFMDEQGKILVKVGDEVDVLIEEAEDDDGRIVLSKDKADRVKVWDEISEAFEADKPVEGRILSRVKGGLSVDIGVKAFLPGSQVDLRPVRNLENLLGERLQFKIIKFNQRRANIVLSRRALLEKEREKMRATTLETLQEAQIIDGVIKNLTDYGAFIDLGGIDGLLHVTDMSWGRVNHPSELFRVGDEIKVKVLRFDAETERVSLGLKQIQPDPWVDAAMRYPIGKRLSGKCKVVEIGNEVEAVVLDVDEYNRKISLGMKQIEPNPWALIEEKYPIGTHVSGEIRNITNFGVFVGLEEGIDGLVHVSDISWTENIKHPSEKFEKGNHVEAVVLKIDRENEKFSLGIKQLESNPWEDILKKFALGSEITGEVTNVTDFGAFVKLEDGIEGLVYSSELSQEPVDKPSDVVSEGDTVTAIVTKVDPVDQKISLSIKAVSDREQREALKKMAAQQSLTQTSTLGDVGALAALKEKLEQGGGEES